MRKVFVVSWFQSENYGTCLQAYATNYILKKNGFDVCFLNRRKYYSIKGIHFLVKKILVLLKGKVWRKKHFKYGRYEEAYSNKIKKIQTLVSKTYTTRNIGSRRELFEIDNYTDCYLVGSDQMWNPWMLSPHYLLDFVPKKSVKPKCSYATSFGVDNIPANKKMIYRKYLSEFTSISVREPRAVEIIEELCGRKSKEVLDPTLLMTSEEWRKFSFQSDIIREHNLNEFVLCYFIGAREFNHLDTVKWIANEINAKVVLIPMKESDYQIDDPEIMVIADACPYDFISLIDKTKLVCTDSFHAVVFSFLLETPFYDFPRFKRGDKYSQESRLQNIIRKFALEDSFWNENVTREEIYSHLKVDYSLGYQRLQKERKNCIKYLVDMINNKVVK